jgi:hypothetical protein
MAFVHGSKAKIYGNGYNLSPYLRNVQSPFTIDTAETSTFGNMHKTYTQGLKDGSFSADGIYDGAASAVGEIFEAALSNEGLDRFTLCIQGDTLGLPAFGFENTTTNVQVASGIGDVAQITLQAQNNMGIDRGWIIHPLVQDVADGNSTGVDMITTSTTTGWAAYLQITQAASTLTSIALEDSADNLAWTPLTGGSFTTLTAVSSQRIVSAVGATVRRYIRVVWNLTTSATFHVVFVRGVNP